jgi:hypothetical protein
MTWRRFFERLLVLLLFVGIGGLVFFLQYRSRPEHIPLARLLPVYLGFAAALPAIIIAGMLRSKLTGKTSAGRTLLAPLAALNLVVALSSAVIGIQEAPNVHAWLSANLASGRLAFYLSAMVFVVQLVRQFAWDDSYQYESFADTKQRRRNDRLVELQAAIYGLGLFLLGFAYNVAEDVRYLGLLSWAIFFVIDDWALIEHFVIRGKARLPYWHFLTILAFNVIIAFASYDIWLELSRLTAASWTQWTEWLTRTIFGLTYLGLLIGSAVLLLPHARRGQPSVATAK